MTVHLQDNRDKICRNCKHFRPRVNKDYGKCPMETQVIQDTYSCDRWEKKDEQV